MPIIPFVIAMTSKTIRTKFKRTAIKLIAVFFVVYALAEVSVLQAYCGNESLGIPPASHLKRAQRNAGSEQKIAAKAAPERNDNEVKPDHDTDAPCEGDEECLGCCSHVVLAFNFLGFDRKADFAGGQLDLPYTDRLITSDLAPLFHPPKTV